MKILALEIETPGVSPNEFAPHLLSEARRVWELYQGGIIRELYFREDVSKAVLMLECQNKEAASLILSSLPLVQHGLISFEVIPLVAYPGFARLFQ